MITPSASDTGKPRRFRRPHCACVSGMPMTLAARATRSAQAELLADAPLVVYRAASCLGVPQMSITSWVMRSMCSTVRLGSTPRSKRWPASVEN